MVQEGEVDHLVAERVWQELAKGLMEQHPSRMFEVLRECGALKRLLPELDKLWGVPQSPEHHPEIDTGIHVMMVLDTAAALGASLEVRFACLTHDLGKGTTPADVLPRHIGHEERSVRLLQHISKRLRTPTLCNELATVVAREHGNIHRSSSLSAAAVVRLLERCDAFRKPERFVQIVQACECDARGRLGLQDQPYPQAQRLISALQKAQSIDTAAIAYHAQLLGLTGEKIGQKIQAARINAVAQLVSS
jgi:tRNA nucleotidyltransferase (CCA-adding enzyme)